MSVFDKHFDKHLQNLQFTQGAEKCDSLEEKIQFCKDFLTKHDSKPKEPPKEKQNPYKDPLSIMKRDYYQQEFKSGPEIPRGASTFYASKWVSLLSCNNDVGKDELRYSIRRELCHDLVYQLASKGLVIFDDREDAQTKDRVFAAKVTVCHNP